jgi:hypothetical protein
MFRYRIARFLSPLGRWTHSGPRPLAGVGLRLYKPAIFGLEWPDLHHDRLPQIAIVGPAGEVTRRPERAA